MSFQIRHEQYQVVVCDICDNFSYIGDRSWREMPHRCGGEALHLCRACRPNALWCAGHQQYHRPDVFHRQPCADCGGLFTSVVRHQLSHCPSCQRRAGVPGQERTEQPQPARSLGQRLFSPLLRYLH